MALAGHCPPYFLNGQLKTDFEVAPVYLKAVDRIQALLCLYFFALLVAALLERELRQAMRRKKIEALPLYPQGRACRWPTARRVVDLSEPIQRHTLTQRKHPAEVLITELARVQRRLLNLPGLSPKHYGHEKQRYQNTSEAPNGRQGASWGYLIGLLLEALVIVNAFLAATHHLPEVGRLNSQLFGYLAFQGAADFF